MSRYLERAEHTAKLLITQFEAMENLPVKEIDQHWRRIYQTLGRTPAGGELTSNLEDEEFMLIDSFTLADDLTFELSNTDSILSNLYFARESARENRNVIDRQFWTRLNSAYLDISQSGIAKIWGNQPINFYTDAEDIARTLSGILEGSVYRDDGWHFLQLGRYIERTQYIAALLHAQVEVFSTESIHRDSIWISLLLLCNGRQAYRRNHSLLSLKPKHVLEFLITDAAHPHSIRYAVDRTHEHLDAVSARQNRLGLAHVNQKLEVTLQLIDQDWHSASLTDKDISDGLQRILSLSRAINDDITATYFLN